MTIDTHPSRKRLLIVGASGFLGRHLAAHLAPRFEIVAVGRDSEAIKHLPGVSESHPLPEQPELAESWQPLLRGIDAVLYAIGAFTDAPADTLEALHHHWPLALAQACAETPTVKHYLQISALGATPEAPTAFLASKGRGDAAVAKLGRETGWSRWTILRPSIVIGRGGGSTELFAALAAAPIGANLPGDLPPVEPLHVADLCTKAEACLLQEPALGKTLALAGAEQISLNDLIAQLRQGWLRLGNRLTIPLPAPLLALGARLAPLCGVRLISPDALTMLRTGKAASPDPDFPLPPARALTKRLEACPLTGAEQLWFRLRFWRVVLLLSLVTLWLSTAYISLAVYPWDESFELLARTGLPEAVWPATLVIASLWDGALGLGLLIRPLRKAALWAQIATVVAFTAILTFLLPDFWAHPFGPVLKNIPILAATALLLILEDAPWTT